MLLVKESKIPSKTPLSPVHNTKKRILFEQTFTFVVVPSFLIFEWKIENDKTKGKKCFLDKYQKMQLLTLNCTPAIIYTNCSHTYIKHQNNMFENNVEKAFFFSMNRRNFKRKFISSNHDLGTKWLTREFSSFIFFVERTIVFI